MMDIKDIEEASKLMEKAHGLLSRGPLSFYLREMAGAYNVLMSRFCPFPIGTKVALSKTPKITPETSPGWMSCKHFLVAGAVGTVVEAGCGEEGFSFHVQFDDETYIHPHTKEKCVPQSPHVFWLGERYLKAASPTNSTSHT